MEVVKKGAFFLVRGEGGKVLGKHLTRARAEIQVRAIRRDRTRRAVKKAWGE